jgi:hypothetical protein
MVCVYPLYNGVIAWLMGVMGDWLYDLMRITDIEPVIPLFFFSFG